MKPAATAAICIALALVTFFQFPGHTWLQQDSQIYEPILEHQRDPAVLRNDILPQHPHVAFTLYDEAARAMRSITGLEFREVLAFQQIVTRALGIWGLWLMATAFGLPAGAAWVVAMICSLGALAVGPQVLTFEYEPTPRAFACPWLLCAVGLTAHRRFTGAGIAAAAAFLYHPPTALPFCILFPLVLLGKRRGRLSAVVPLVAAVVILLLASRDEAHAALFTRLTPLQEQLQRMRTAYVWISTWPRESIWHYGWLFAILLAAIARTRRIAPELRVFVLGLPVLGILSMPLSWLLLEHGKWAFIPQLQPLRTLLVVVLMAQFTTAAAATKGRIAESIVWFAVAYLIPLPLDWRTVSVALGLAAIGFIAAYRVPVLALAAFWAIPLLGGIVNYPRLHTPDLAQLAQWARSSTPRDSVFLFPDAGRALAPGIFRSEALRAVYVDWKGGGQVNYSKEFGEDWWFRWQQTIGRGFKPDDLPRYDALGIQYVVLKPANRLARTAAYENGSYVVYALR
jgi:hypothetical protein